MRRTISGSVLLAWIAAMALAAVTAAPAAVKRRAPAASFLEYRVDTIEALATQAERNPRVRARYARHFGIPAASVARYIRQNLVVSYLPAGGMRTVYYVKPGGKIYSRKTRLSRGTRVLTLRNGEPVLRWLCGNAMVPNLPRVSVRMIPPPRKVMPVSIPAEQIAAVSNPVSVPDETMVQRTVFYPPLPLPRRIAPWEKTVTPAMPLAPVIPRRKARLSPLMVVPLIPLTFNNGGGHSDKPLPPTEIPVPEPNTAAMLMLTVVPFGWAAWRARRRSR